MIKLDNYFSPEHLKQAIEEFVNLYNTERYHESLSNVTPEDVFTGRHHRIVKRSEKIKQKTIQIKRINHQNRKLKNSALLSLTISSVSLEDVQLLTPPRNYNNIVDNKLS